MMIELDPTFRVALLLKIAQREFKERKGAHCSDLVYCLNKQALRRLHPFQPSDHELLLYSLGWATQRWLTGKSEDEPEKEVDGIVVTLDALTDEGLPWELKATFQSSQRPIEDNAHWIRQIMAQCYVTGTATANLSRLEIMGNWKSVFGKREEKDLPENQKPTLSAYRLEFSQEEIDRNWQWLQVRRDMFNIILSTNELFPKIHAIPSGQEWECKFCPYQGGFCCCS